VGQARVKRPRPTRRARPAERRPQQRSVETRDRLVDAALQEFATHGFEGATTREIARRAGVALAALPYHFTTKEALWRAAADRIFALLSETFRARFTGLEGVDLTTRLRLILPELLLRGCDQAEIMFGVLVVVLGRDRVAGRACVTRQLNVFLGDVRGGAADLDIRAVRFEHPGHRVLTAPVIVVAAIVVVIVPVTHPLVVLTVSHVSPLFQP